ncbi:transposase [Elusimicrobiota bacterium]
MGKVQSFGFQKSQGGHRPRVAWKSPLYRIVQDNLETFLIRGAVSPPSRFAEPSLRSFLECGVPRFGIMRFACSRCNKSIFIPFSCKKRSVCPSCDAKRATLKSLRLTEELLPHVPYRQWVLVLPKRLRYFVNRNHRLAGEISRIFAETLGQFYRDRTVRNSLPAGILNSAQPAQLHFIQRFGARVNLHVHIHAVVSDGVFAAGGEGRLVFFPALRQIAPEQLQRLAETLRRRILKRLTRIGAIPETTAAEMSLWPNSGFSVNAQVRIRHYDRRGLERLLSYCLRPSISLKRLGYFPQRDMARYHVPRDNETLEWNTVEFLERFSALIPPPRINLVRYSGALGPRSSLHRLISEAAKRRISCARLKDGWSHSVDFKRAFSEAKAVARKAFSSAWAKCLSRILEASPIICPQCKLEMRPVAAILDTHELTRLLGYLDLPTEFPATKPARAPPQPCIAEDSQINPLAEAFCGIDEALEEETLSSV